MKQVTSHESNSPKKREKKLGGKKFHQEINIGKYNKHWQTYALPFPAMLSLLVSDPFVSECCEKRKASYVGTPRNIYRHVIMSDIKDATTSLPRVRKPVKTG